MMRIFALIVIFSCLGGLPVWAVQTPDSEGPSYWLSLNVVCQIRTRIHSLTVGMTRDEVNRTLGIDIGRRAVMASGPLADFRVSYFLRPGDEFLIVWDEKDTFKRIIFAGNTWQQKSCPNQAQPNKSGRERRSARFRRNSVAIQTLAAARLFPYSSS